MAPFVLSIGCAMDEFVPFHPLERVGKRGLFDIYVLVQFFLSDVVALPKEVKHGQVTRLDVVRGEPHVKSPAIQALESGQ